MSPTLLVTGACSPPAGSHTTQYRVPAVTVTGVRRSAPCQPFPRVVLNGLDHESAESGCAGNPPLSAHSATEFVTARSPVNSSMRVTTPDITGTQAMPTMGPPIETLS